MSGDINKVQKQFGDRAEFVLVYLREAHPSDGWTMSDWSVLEDPKTQDERNKVAKQCCEKLKFDFTSVVDTMNDSTAISYAAWPERLFVIDTDGKVAYAGHQGPWGFWPTDRAVRNVRNLKGPSLESFLEKFLDKKAASK